MQRTHDGRIRRIRLESAAVQGDELVNTSNLRALLILVLFLFGGHCLFLFFGKFLNRNLILNVIAPFKLLF